MMPLHIIGGDLKNRIIKSPSGKEGVTRPTTALLRKSIFDILASVIENSHFLDLFAGTGAIGLEALSRGAQRVTFVEKNKTALFCIRENLKNFCLERQATLLNLDVQKALLFLEKKGAPFQIVYSDPPYPLAHLQAEILSFLDTSSLLTKGTIVFLEEGAPSSLKLDKIPVSRLAYKNSRKFGNSLLHQYIAGC